LIDHKRKDSKIWQQDQAIQEGYFEFGKLILKKKVLEQKYASHQNDSIHVLTKDFFHLAEEFQQETNPMYNKIITINGLLYYPA